MAPVRCPGGATASPMPARRAGAEVDVPVPAAAGCPNAGGWRAGPDRGEWKQG